MPCELELLPDAPGDPVSVGPGPEDQGDRGHQDGYHERELDYVEVHCSAFRGVACQVLSVLIASAYEYTKLIMFVNRRSRLFLEIVRSRYGRSCCGLTSNRRHARIADMTRDKPIARAKRFKAGSEPEVYGPKRIRAVAEALRETIASAEAIAKRMEDREPPMASVVVQPGEGAASLGLAKKSVKAWADGIVAAFINQIEKGE